MSVRGYVTTLNTVSLSSGLASGRLFTYSHQGRAFKLQVVVLGRLHLVNILQDTPLLVRIGYDMTNPVDLRNVWMGHIQIV